MQMKQGDRRPFLTATLRNDKGQPIDLTNCAVSLVVASDDGVKVDAACTVTDAAQGKVSYEWGPTDTDTAGRFRAVFRVTYPDNTRMTVPTESYLLLEVEPDLA